MEFRIFKVWGGGDIHFRDDAVHFVESHEGLGLLDVRFGFRSGFSAPIVWRLFLCEEMSGGEIVTSWTAGVPLEAQRGLVYLAGGGDDCEG